MLKRLTPEKLLYASAVFLLAYMPFHIFLSQWLSTFTGGLEAWKIAKDILTALLVNVGVAAVLLRRRYTRTYLWFVGFAAAYLVLHLLSLFLTDQPPDTGLLATVYNNRLVWYLLIGYSVVLLLPAVGPARAIMLRRIVLVLLAVSTVVSFLGLMQWVLPKDVMTNFGYSIDRGVKPNFFIDDKPDLPRVFSTIRDPNSLGAFLILPIILLSSLLVHGWKGRRRLLLGGLLLLHVLVLFLTFSRSALLGLLLSLGALGFLQYGKTLRRHARLLLVVASACLLVFVAGVFALRDQYVAQNIVFHADESTVLDDPNELRVKLYKRSIDGIIDNPEGHGPGTAGLVSIRLPDGLLTENYYLQIGYEVGLLGLGLFILFLALVARALWQARRRATDDGLSALTVNSLLASFTGLLLVALLLHVWSNEAVACSWFLLAGAALGLKTTAQESSAAEPYRATRR